jgi:hypothetical protein
VTACRLACLPRRRSLHFFGRHGASPARRSASSHTPDSWMVFARTHASLACAVLTARSFSTPAHRDGSREVARHQCPRCSIRLLGTLRADLATRSRGGDSDRRTKHTRDAAPAVRLIYRARRAALSPFTPPFWRWPPSRWHSPRTFPSFSSSAPWWNLCSTVRLCGAARAARG